MPSVRERAVPHGQFTDHWIRVAGETPADTARSSRSAITAYFARDRRGSDARVYHQMGEVVYATLASDFRVLAEAATSLRESLGRDTTRSDAFFLLGIAYQQLGRTDDAIRALENSLRIDRDRPERLRALALSYERAGRPAVTIDSLYRRALALQPAFAWIRADYARFLQSQANRDEAVRQYREALAEQPSLATAWFDLGTVLAEQRDTEKATAAFREAAELDPDLARAIASLVAVETAEGDRVISTTSLRLPLNVAVAHRSRPLDVAAAEGGVRFAGVPPQATVIIARPDGSIVRTLRPDRSSYAVWDVTNEAGKLAGGGLYRVLITARDARGNSLPPLRLSFGLVRAIRE